MRGNWEISNLLLKITHPVDFIPETCQTLLILLHQSQPSEDRTYDILAYFLRISNVKIICYLGMFLAK